MVVRRASLAVGVASLLGLLTTNARADVIVGGAPGAPCDPSGLACAVGSASLRGEIRTRLGTEIDSGWLEAGPAKVRTRVTIEPPNGRPLATVEMPAGAVVEATWPEKGFLTLRPISREGAIARMNVEYTLAPTVDAEILGIQLNLPAADLVNQLPGAAFDYRSQGESPFAPWGFGGVIVQPAGPPLRSSTLFSVGFDKVGISAGAFEGALAIQATATPSFVYRTKEIRLDSGVVATEGGSAKIPVRDEDALDLNALVVGSVSVTGDVEIRPVLRIDTIAGRPTFGLLELDFDGVSRPIVETEPQPVVFQSSTIHVPLPNVKVPTTPVGLGNVGSGQKAEKKISIANTGELGGVVTFDSSNPEFVVPGGPISIAPKGKYDLKVVFKPKSDAPASTTITVKSNDPDSPEQTIRIAANGAVLGDEDGDPTSADGDEQQASDGCACDLASAPRRSPLGGAAFAVLLGLALAGRRRR
mgnify:CR=1 FL=1